MAVLRSSARSRVGVLALAVALSCGACAETEPPRVDTSPITVPQGGSPSPSPTPEVPQATVTTVDPRAPEEVLAAAIAAVELVEAETGGAAYEIETSGGGWEVHVAVQGREREVRVDRRGERVLDDRDDGTPDEDDRAALAAARISLSEALQQAFDEVPGVLDEASLDEGDGGYVWEVSLTVGDREPEVYVSISGGVVEIERD